MKLLQRIKNFFKRKQKQEKVTVKPMDISPSSRLLRTLRKREKEENAMITKKMAQGILEENARKEFLPETHIRRRQITHKSHTPARHHHDAVAKFMKGKGRHSKTYRGMTKRHTTDEELENA